MTGREKVALAFAIAIVSVVLTLVVYPIADHFALTTPGTFIGGHFFTQSAPQQGWHPGELALEEITVDVACWFVLLSGVCWVIWKRYYS